MWVVHSLTTVSAFLDWELRIGGFWSGSVEGFLGSSGGGVEEGGAVVFCGC